MRRIEHLLRVLAETDDTGRVLAEYIYANGTLVAQRDASGQVFYVHTDALGTPPAPTNVPGTLAAYDAYDTVRTIASAEISPLEKGRAGGLFVVGAILPWVSMRRWMMPWSRWHRGWHRGPPLIGSKNTLRRET